MNNETLHLITRGAITAALYVTLTLVVSPLSYGPIQLRISECLTILPFFEPAAIWGLFVGDFIANFFGGNGFPDIVFGSLFSLIAGYLTWKIRNPYLSLIPPVIINAFGIAGILWYVSHVPYWLTVITVGFGEFIAIYFLGLPILMVILKNNIFIREKVIKQKFGQTNR